MSNTTERITDGMTLNDAIFALSNGNPGAVVAMIQMLEVSKRTFDDAPISNAAAKYYSKFETNYLSMLPVLILDEIGIYGSHIWVFFKDWCGGDASRAVKLLLSQQAGVISFSASDLEESECGKPCPFDIDTVFTFMREHALEQVGKMLQEDK